MEGNEEENRRNEEENRRKEKRCGSQKEKVGISGQSWKHNAMILIRHRPYFNCFCTGGNWLRLINDNK